MAPSPSTRLAYAAWVAVCLLWGTTYLAIRLALDTVPPMLLGGFRWIAAGGALVAALKLGGHQLPRPREWPMLALLGVLLIGLGNGGVTWAEQTLPSGLTAMLVAVTPFWMVAMEYAFGDAPPLSRRLLAGLGTGFAGIVLLVWPELALGPGPAHWMGIAATQVACLGWAIGSSYSRRRRHSENVLVTAAVQMLFGGLAMLAVGLVNGEWAHLSFTMRSGSALGYLIVFGSLGGFSAYAFALKHLPLATVSLYAYVNPVIAMVLGALVLGEPLGVRLALSCGVVLAGMAMVRE